MKFKVRICNLKCTGLPAKDSNGFSDPYLKCNFDSFKKFQTPKIDKTLNPEWDFDLLFYYETRYFNKLANKVFQIKVYDHNKITSDDYIGQATVDLHVLATGPAEYDLPIWDGSTPHGRIQFRLEMNQMADLTVFMKDLAVCGVPCENMDDKPSCNLLMGYTGDAKLMVRTSRKPQTVEPEWQVVDQVRLKATLHELFEESLTITLEDRNARPSTLGEAHLHFRENFCFENRKEFAFKLNINVIPSLRNFVPQGGCYVEGTMYFDGFPEFSQMTTGKYDGNVILYGAPFVKGVRMPVVSVKGMKNASNADMKVVSRSTAQAAVAMNKPVTAASTTPSQPAVMPATTPALPVVQQPVAVPHTTPAQPVVVRRGPPPRPVIQKPAVQKSCCVCGQVAPYICFQTKKPVCSTACKQKNLTLSGLSSTEAQPAGEHLGTIKMTLHSAKALRNVAPFGKQSPHVVFFFGSDRQSSKVSQDGHTTPDYNDESFTFSLNTSDTAPLIVSAYFGPSEIGNVDVSIEDIMNSSGPKWYALKHQGKMAGFINLTSEVVFGEAPETKKASIGGGLLASIKSAVTKKPVVVEAPVAASAPAAAPVVVADLGMDSSSAEVGPVVSLAPAAVVAPVTAVPAPVTVAVAPTEQKLFASVSGALKVCVHGCTGLRNVAAKGGKLKKQSPYVELYFGSEKFTSQVHKKGGTDPEFDEEFLVHVATDKTVHVTVFAEEKEIGTLDVSIDELATNKTPTGHILMDKGRPCGTVLLSTKPAPQEAVQQGLNKLATSAYAEAANHVKVTVIGVEGLRNIATKNGKFGKQSPKVALWLGPQKFETKVVKKGGIECSINETFDFTVRGDNTLHLTIWADDTELGTADIKLDELERYESKHSVMDKGRPCGVVLLKAEGTGKLKKAVTPAMAPSVPQPQQAQMYAEPVQHATTPAQPSFTPPVPTAQHSQLPQGWESAFDPSTQRTYYKNTVTRQTQWHKPTLPVVRAAPAPVQHRVVQPQVQAQALPRGWQQAADPRTGRIFYKNNITRQTSWNRPPMPQQQQQRVQQTGFGVRATPQQQTFGQRSTPAVNPASTNPLPNGWAQAIDPGSGRVFYKNHLTRQTSWTRPAAPQVQQSRPVQPQSAHTALPQGWEQAYDQTGRVYFKNQYTRQTQWTRPTY